MFDAEQFCLDYDIDFATSGKHNRRGWVNIPCPFCTGNPGYHGGINTKYGYYNCHRCGSHWLPKVIKEVSNVSFGVAQQLIYKYSTGDLQEEYSIDRPDTLVLPKEFKKLKKVHYDYLKSRGFKPSVAREWGLLGTELLGQYNYRIIAPIYLDGELISYQGRDYTGMSPLKYKACAKPDEVFEHQNTIYGIDHIKSDCIVICEGITDVWKIGKGIAGATFGIDWTPSQARMIANRFKRAYILYDIEEQAQNKAHDLYQYLTARNLYCEILTLRNANDPGEMSYKEIKELKKEIGLV